MMTDWFADFADHPVRAAAAMARAHAEALSLGRPPDAGTLVDLSATSPVAAPPMSVGEASGCPCNVVAIDSRRT